MGLYDLNDRINWRQACLILGCGKSTFFRMVREGVIPAYGLAERGRFFLKSDCMAYLSQKSRKKRKM